MARSQSSANAMLSMVNNLTGVLGGMSKQLESVEFSGSDSNQYTTVKLDAMMGIKAIEMNWDNFFAAFFNGVSDNNKKYIQNTFNTIFDSIADAQASAIENTGINIKKMASESDEAEETSDDSDAEVVNFEDFAEQK